MKSLNYIVFGVFCVAMAHCNAPKEDSNTKPNGDVIELPEPGMKNMNSEELLTVKQADKPVLKSYEVFFQEDSLFRAYGFDYPVGAPDAKNYYNAQGFGENSHLGDDWNGTGGGNTDLGDPVYAVANGYVSECYDAGGGWGNVVRIIHKIGEEEYVESVYAHLDSMMVNTDSGIKKGDQLGTIGNANGAYLAHLHLEIRHQVEKELGGGYSADTAGYLNPTEFINSNRRVMWRRVE